MPIKIFIIFLILLNFLSSISYAVDSYMSPEIYRAYGKQQIRTKDEKGNTKIITPNYNSYAERNQHVSEKIVAIYHPKSPCYGYQYVLYTPVGKYVGHHKIMQPSLNGYGLEPIPDGGEEYGSLTPCFRTIQEAKHYYYPEWY